MKKIQLSKKQLRSCLMLCSLAIFAYSYLVIYTDHMEQTEQLRLEIASVNAQIDTRRELLQGSENLEDKIATVEAHMQDIIGQYPSKLSIPDTLLFLQEFERDNKVELLSIALGEQTTFYDTMVPSRMYTEADSYELDGGYMKGVRTSISISFQGSYKDVKACMKYIEEYDKRITLDQISMAYDTTTGLVNGNMSITLYAIEGNGMPYEVPVLNDINIGKKIIFDTVK